MALGSDDSTRLTKPPTGGTYVTLAPRLTSAGGADDQLAQPPNCAPLKRSMVVTTPSPLVRLGRNRRRAPSSRRRRAAWRASPCLRRKPSLELEQPGEFERDSRRRRGWWLREGGRDQRVLGRGRGHSFNDQYGAISNP
jgi:hypothetical protein